MMYDGTNRYTCNSDGSLASVLAGDVALSYKYDALGRRVLKESSAADSVLYLYDQADRCIAEYTTADDCATLACSAGYVYADADALGAPIAVEDSAGSYQYVATDPQGSVIYQTPSCSHIVLVKYDAYGNIYNTSAGDLDLPFRFAGMRCEKDADIYLTPNRAYSPALGRWLTPDPLGTLPNAKQGNRFAPLVQYTDGLNLYEYCAGDPVNERDLWGLVVREDYGYQVDCGNLYNTSIVNTIANNLGFYHCEISQKSIFSNRKDRNTFPVWIDRNPNRKMLMGISTSKSCKCVTKDDIDNCLEKQVYKYDGYGNNCHTQTAIALSKCCLKSTWRAGWWAGKDPLCIEWKYVSTSEGTIVPVCVKRLPDYKG